MSASQLSPAQAQALFNILTHYETYSEIEDFKWPEAIHNYGYPFKKERDVQTTSPILQNLLCKFMLKIPGANGVAPEFWQERVQGLVSRLGEAELSESYDKGTMGIRKTLATAGSVIFEYIARGCFGGYPKDDTRDLNRSYDMSKSEDLTQSWDDAIQQLVYGNLLDELIDQIAETGSPEDHSPGFQAVVEYIVITIATFLHYIFVLSPDGQNLLKLIKNTHRLVPYLLIRQTLQIGNAATMINGMMKLMLTKLSLNGLTSAVGLSKTSDAGMNLLQRILSQIMAWDETEFRKIAASTENAKGGPSKEHFQAIKSHLEKPRKQHENIRNISKEQSKSIITVILESQNPNLATSLSDSQHSQLLEYYAAHLSIRDCEEITKVFCRQQPDLVTQAIRDMVAVFDPIIRSIHEAVNLSASMSDVEHFLDDMIEMSQYKKTNGSPGKSEAVLTPPSLQDYFSLLRKHKASLYRFFEQIIKNGPEVVDLFRGKAKEALIEFRRPVTNATAGGGAAGAMTASLNAIFSVLPAAEQTAVLESIDAHSAYLASLHTFSASKMQSVLANSSPTMYGPGTYLPRWQALLDQTLITPATASGPVRRGKDVKYKEGKGAYQNGKKERQSTVDIRVVMGEVPEAPDTSVVVKALGKPFKEILMEMEVTG